MSVFKNEDPLAPNRFCTFRWVNQSPYLVGIHGLHFRFHGFKPFLRIWSCHGFHISCRLILLHEQYIIMLIHEKSISLRLLMYPTRPTWSLCHLSRLFFCNSLQTSVRICNFLHTWLLLHNNLWFRFPLHNILWILSCSSIGSSSFCGS